MVPPPPALSIANRNHTSTNLLSVLCAILMLWAPVAPAAAQVMATPVPVGIYALEGRSVPTDEEAFLFDDAGYWPDNPYITWFELEPGVWRVMVVDLPDFDAIDEEDPPLSVEEVFESSLVSEGIFEETFRTSLAGWDQWVLRIQEPRHESQQQLRDSVSNVVVGDFTKWDGTVHRITAVVEEQLLKPTVFGDVWLIDFSVVGIVDDPDEPGAWTDYFAEQLASYFPPPPPCDDPKFCRTQLESIFPPEGQDLTQPCLVVGQDGDQLEVCGEELESLVLRGEIPQCAMDIVKCSNNARLRCLTENVGCERARVAVAVAGGWVCVRIVQGLAVTVPVAAGAVAIACFIADGIITNAVHRHCRRGARKICWQVHRNCRNITKACCVQQGYCFGS